MMPRLTPDSEAIVKSANSIAREYELDYVGTEHILLAILDHAKCCGGQVLAKLGVTGETARGVLDDLLRRDKEDTWVFGRLPGTPHFRNVMANAIEEAKAADRAEIDSEHLLLALLREEGSMAQRILAKLKVTAKACRDEAQRLRAS